jgi:PiT family inorganic phosphate transporter
MTNALMWVVVVVALGFNFTNGFHDTANAVATSVSTRAMTPRTAVLIAAVMNLLGAFASTAVAKTIASGLIDPALVTQRLMLAALIGAIAWNLLTWRLGLPSSSSHALVGGLIGAALAANGTQAVMWGGIWHKVLFPGIVSPIVGFALAGLAVVIILWGFHRVRPAPLNRSFRHLQILSGSFVAFAHGTNDAQKTMGVIALALYTGGAISHFEIPWYVQVSSAVSMGAGTYFGGWRIMRTVGNRIFKLEPPQGFAAQATSGLVLFWTARQGFPISTTHVITGSVMGAGATTKLSAVRWGVAGNIVAAWMITLPAAAAVSAIVYLIA